MTKRGTCGGALTEVTLKWSKAKNEKYLSRRLDQRGGGRGSEGRKIFKRIQREQLDQCMHQFLQKEGGGDLRGGPDLRRKKGRAILGSKETRGGERDFERHFAEEGSRRSNGVLKKKI